MRSVIFICLGATTSLILGSTSALSNEICRTAALRAAADHSIPPEIMVAITRVETGSGKSRPTWPWTTNSAGEGRFFETPSRAIAHIHNELSQGVSNIDVGCFQLNYRWHGVHFASVEEMITPASNAAYAARFLQELYEESGSWSKAAGMYHSRTKRYSERYSLRISEALRQIEQEELSVPVDIASANWFPLLQNSTGSTAMGSLVPINQASRSQ